MKKISIKLNGLCTRTYTEMFCFLCSRHIDGNHKIIHPYRIVIYGGIDGYSCLVVFSKASTNNTAATVLNLFHSTVERYNLPSRRSWKIYATAKGYQSWKYNK